MKKVLVIALAVLMLVGAVSVLAACNGGETYTGYCYYTIDYGTGPTGYGCVVDVTVKGDTIVGIKLYTDDEALAWANDNKVDWLEGTHRTTPTWRSVADYNAYIAAYPDKAEELKYQVPHDGDLGYTMAEAGYEKWFEDTFIGKTVEEVNRYAAYATGSAQVVATEGVKLAGATQSSARIIVAVQNALAQIEAK